jgi:hypothetical protein
MMMREAALFRRTLVTFAREMPTVAIVLAADLVAGALLK